MYREVCEADACEFMIETPDKVHCGSQFMTCRCLFSQFFPPPQQQQQQCASAERNPRLQYLSCLGYVTHFWQTVTFVTDVANMCHRLEKRWRGRLCFPNLVVI